MTKEIVKPVVHEQVEEHITRHTHNYDVYHKILPVRDVEVLPARHWVPGPDGRLVQVDEKDVYSGAAWSLGQTDGGAGNEMHQDQTREEQCAYDQPGVGNLRTLKHATVEQPKVIPGRVNQVYQTQIHRPEVDYCQIPRKPVNEGHPKTTHGEVHHNEKPQHGDAKDQVDERPPGQGQVSQHAGARMQEHDSHLWEKQKGNNNLAKEDNSHNVGQRHANHEQADDSIQERDINQGDRGQTSPGLLDPYRVKNGPVHHTDGR